MLERSSYDYATIRVVPHVERGECINVGVILFARSQSFLGTLTHLDTQRLLALAPDLDLKMVQRQLEMITLVSQGAEEAGKIGQMSLSERFHWLVSPRSTIIQASPVHSGLCISPEAALHHLFSKLVMVSVPSHG
ncbi:MAG TPA: DUF3037 domain-containing protein [Ktedonobacteraceae bacterium]|nr:DUF3037 domain-containing protein [Ktedonobacteraceae bacterium]